MKVYFSLALVLTIVVACQNKDRSDVKIDSGNKIFANTPEKILSVIQVDIKAKNDKDALVTYACAGNVVSKNTVLTAAHCFKHEKLKEVISVCMKIEGKEQCGLKYSKHPTYTQYYGNGSDTALVVVPGTPFTHGMSVSETPAFKGQNILIAGFAKENFNDTSVLKTWGRNVIEDIVQTDLKKNSTFVVRYGGNANRAATSSGDSGGPVVDEKTCKIVGIISALDPKPGSSKISWFDNSTTNLVQSWLVSESQNLGGYVCGPSGTNSDFCSQNFKISSPITRSDNSLFPCDSNGGPVIEDKKIYIKHEKDLSVGDDFHFQFGAPTTTKKIQLCLSDEKDVCKPDGGQTITDVSVSGGRAIAKTTKPFYMEKRKTYFLEIHAFDKDEKEVGSRKVSITR